jgi:hypothetical protein
MTPLLRSVLCCAGLLSSSLIFAADNTMTPEERTVRLAYAKLAFAIEVQTVEQSLHQAHRKLSTAALQGALRRNQLRIELSGFNVGDIAEIADRNIQEVVPLPRGENILSISAATHTIKEQDGKQTTENSVEIPVWQTGPNVGNGDIHYTVAEMLALNQPNDIFERYAAYTVVVTFQGPSRKYRALALFGKDAKGAGEVSFTDTVLGSGPQTMAASSSYPAVLLETVEGQNPAVVDWFESKQMPLASCTSGTRDVCCDPATLKCGISSLDLKNASAYAAVRGQSSNY